MKTFLSIFFYSSLLLSDPGEELQDGSCHPGVGKQRLSDFRQDPSWGALCLAWPPRRGYSGRIPSLRGGEWGARTQRENRERWVGAFLKWNQPHIQTGSGWPKLPPVLPHAPSFLQMWNKIKPKVCFTHTVSVAREQACLVLSHCLYFCFHTSALDII